MKFSAAHKAELYMELGKLLKAGFPIENAFKTLREQTALPPPLERYVTEGQEGLDRGRTIAEAIAAIDLPITDLEKTMVAAGERGGVLEEVFTNLSGYFRRLTLARKAILTSLVYPIILFHVTVLMMAAIRAVQFGNTFQTWWPPLLALIIFYGFFALVIFGYETFHLRASRDARLDSLFARLPLFSDVRRAMASERFCRVFKIYLLAGKKPSEAVLAAGEASQSGVIYEASKSISHQVNIGIPLGKQLSNYAAFQGDFARAMSTAEEAGNLDDEVGRWAKIFELTAAEALDRLQQWIPRIFYGLVVIFVVWQILQMGMNYISSMGEMLDGL